MAPFGQSIATYGNWTTNTPENSGNNNGGCYNGGNMNITVDENDENLIQNPMKRHCLTLLLKNILKEILTHLIHK